MTSRHSTRRSSCKGSSLDRELVWEDRWGSWPLRSSGWPRTGGRGTVEQADRTSKAASHGMGELVRLGCRLEVRRYGVGRDEDEA